MFTGNLTMQEHDYEAGLRDGRIQALEKITAEHHDRLNQHSERFRVIERIMWGLIGAYVFVQFVPALKKLFL